MAEFDVVSFVTWSIIAGILIAVSGLSYRAYRRKRNETPSP